jgi:3-methyl-2-oxobutanoate hydroxymethyltransferase
MEKMTIQHVMGRKKNGILSMLTAYDYTTAKILDKTGVDIILVGDSYGMTHLGYENTLPVTMEEMISITAGVVRGTKHALVVADMPFLSYQTDLKTARLNAGRFLKEAGADAVKIENSRNVLDIIKGIIEIDVPVMGHIGLTPQSVKRMGGFKIQGKTSEEALQLIRAAKELSDAGVFSIVLEGIPSELAEIITEEIPIPTIGIAAGNHCDGQVLVLNDLLGLSGETTPRHAKVYASIGQIMEDAVRKFIEEISAKQFPDYSHSLHLDKEAIKRIREDLGRQKP